MNHLRTIYVRFIWGPGGSEGLAMRELFLPGIVLAALLAGCDRPPAGLPTTPTPAAAVSDLRWDIVAPGCVVARPVPMLTDTPPESRAATDAGLRARWLVYRSPDDRLRRYIVGDFVRLDKVWALCAWDELVREVIA